MATSETNNTCSNCLHRNQSSRFPPCIDCLSSNKPGDQFPGWKPVVEPEQ